jgi:ribosome maturation factor RimP
MDLPHEKPAVGSLDRAALLALIEPVLHAHGAALVEVSFKTERPGWVLRVAIEREGSTHPGGGVTVDLCADVSRALSAILDESEFIAHAYQLEVASPGVERTLRSTEELARFIGQPVKVMLREPAPDGQRVLRGTLLVVGEDNFVVRVDGNEITCPVGNVKQANLQLEFGTAHKQQPTKRAANRPTNDGGSSSSPNPSKSPRQAKGKAKTPHPKSAASEQDTTSSQTTDGESQDRSHAAETE